MAGAFSRGGTVSPTVAEDLFTMPPVCWLCAEKEGISCIEDDYSNSSSSSVQFSYTTLRDR